MTYDVIVVGARCAGAVLGVLLAKSGLKTLILDADPLPSDMPMSTHYVHPPGMDVLDEIGVGDRVRSVTPASSRGHYQVDDHHVFTGYDAGRVAYCPRRSTVDTLLQEAATAAGAELRDRHRVVELVKDGERVAGVVVESPTGRETLRSKLVVGADGRNSMIARLTGVEEYLKFPMTRGLYWFYFPTPSIWRDDPRYDWDVFMGWQGNGLRYVFQCDGDVILLVAAPPREEALRWGKDYKAKTLEYLRQSDVTGPLAEASDPLGKGMGLLKADFFYRRPVGPGFALVGDAGNFKDFVTGHGMTDAFLGAKRLHRAILADSELAYERYWRERDAETLPLYFDSIRLGEVGFNDAFTRLLFQNLARHPELAARLPRVADRRISPFHAFSSGELVRMLVRDVLRGRFDAVGPFLSTGKRMSEYVKEHARRQAGADALAAAEGTPSAQELVAVSA